MRLSIHRAFLSAAVCCLVSVVGCGPQRPAMAPVHGKVTLGGKPLAGGRIAFYPAEGRPALGPIAADGTYKLTTFLPDDGAILGKHRVTIEATKVTASSQPKSFEEERRRGFDYSSAPQVVWIVPEKYARRETSPLTAEVSAGENTLDFALPLK